MVKRWIIDTSCECGRFGDDVNAWEDKAGEWVKYDDIKHIIQNAASNTDYEKCSHVVDLICDVLLIEKSENMEINLHTIYSEAVEIKRIIRELREKFS